MPRIFPHVIEGGVTVLAVGCDRKTTLRHGDERELRLFITVGTRLLLLLRQGGMTPMPLAAVFAQGPHQNSLQMYFLEDVTTSPARQPPTQCPPFACV